METKVKSHSEPGRYDVFLSFGRYPHRVTRDGFIGHLYNALVQSKVNVFMKDEEPEGRGESNDAINKAIENSRIAIVVFSENYACSRWCLDEVVYIMECRESKGLIVVPVFYYIEPADVRGQVGYYSEAFHSHEKSYGLDVVKMWRSALKEAGMLQGLTTKDRRESLLVEEIVSDVLSKLEMPFLDPAKLIGNYDVFLCFRGPDTRHGFTGHLYSALEQSNVSVFIDEVIPLGTRYDYAFTKAVENSRIAIVVFSRDFASSRWCLKDIANIMECHKSKGLMVFPVFYDVCPSDVRKQMGTYAESFLKHEKLDLQDTMKWRIALKEAAGLAGFSLENGSRAGIIPEIVRDVLSELDRIDGMPFDSPANLVGMNSHLKAVYKLLDMDKDDVLMVALCGMGGLGKTTIAQTIFENIARNFQYTCFLEHVRETCQHSMPLGLLKLQKKLLLRMLGERKDIWDVNQGSDEIKQRCGTTKTLLVIDDISHSQQLEKLVGSFDWFGPGSRIIITTRDRKLVSGQNNVKLYDVPELGRRDAEQLFRKTFPIDNDRFKEYEGHVSKVLDYTTGLPLAIKVVAANLQGKIASKWDHELEVLKEIPNPDIFDVLKLSYNGLNDHEKNTLLDIACFFKGQPLNYVRSVVECCMPYPDEVIGVLKSRYLISIKHDKVDMHDMIQEMGRIIVGQESRCPGKRSRLWSQEEILEVLTGDTGTETIRGINVELATKVEEKFNANAFKHMGDLRVFIAHDALPFDNSINFPRSLKWLDWSGYPSLLLPLHHHDNRQLVGLYLSKSHVILSEDDLKPFCNLKFINFSYCTSLRKIPDLSSLSHLKSLDAEECKELVEVHQSLGSLEKLVHLNFLNCNKLRTFPITLSSKDLQDLLLKGCLKLSKFPEILVQMEKLTELTLDETAIDELPSSIENLIGLEEFYLENCRKLKTLPSSIYRLQKLRRVSFVDCSELGEFPELGDGLGGSLPALVYLDLQRCGLQEINFLEYLDCKTTLENLELSGSRLGIIPKCIEEFIALQQLNLENCKQLHEIHGLPPRINYLTAKGCESLEWHVPLSEMLKSQLVESPRFRHIDFIGCCKLGQNLTISANFFSMENLHVDSQIKIIYPGSEIPKWFEHQNAEGSLRFSVITKLYQNIAGFAFCVVIGSGGRKIPALSCEIQVYNNNQMTYYIADTFHSLEMDHMWLVYVPCTMMWGWETKMKERSSELRCSELKVLCKLSRGKLKCSGVHLVLKEDGSREGPNSWKHQRFDKRYLQTW